MHIARHRVSSLLFGFSAIGPLGVWYLLLFTAVPEQQEPLQHAASLTAYVFTESEAPWFFVVLALTPALLLLLAASYWRAAPAGAEGAAWLKWLGVAATVLAAVVCWPVAITSAQATYYAFRKAGG